MKHALQDRFKLIEIRSYFITLCAHAGRPKIIEIFLGKSIVVFISSLNFTDFLLLISDTEITFAVQHGLLC